MIRFGDLGENVMALDDLNKSNKNLAAKLAIAEESKAHEQSVQFLLNFELSQIKAQINEAKRDIESLDEEQRRLVLTNQELGSQVKLIRNYFGYVNSLQVDRKAEYLQNLKVELSSLDFTYEARNEPDQSMDNLTQLPRRG